MRYNSLKKPSRLQLNLYPCRGIYLSSKQDDKYRDRMETPHTSFRPYLASMLTMVILGWGGLAWLFYATEPTIWPRWGFYVLWTLALTGTAIPITWFLNLRFPSEPPAGGSVIVRQAIWFGVYGSTLAWLQLGHILTIWYAISLALGLFAIEYLIRIREHSRWTPPPGSETPPANPPDA